MKLTSNEVERHSEMDSKLVSDMLGLTQLLCLLQDRNWKEFDKLVDV